MLRVLKFAMVLLVMFGAASAARAQAFSNDASSLAVADCPERCHEWLIGDTRRTVTAEVRAPAESALRRIHYAAGWLTECPKGRVAFARAIVGHRNSGGFLTELLERGFCPRVSYDHVADTAPYLASPVWNDIVFDAERATLLTRSEYAERVAPVVRKLFRSQEATRWYVFSVFVRSSGVHADLFKEEITEFLGDPDPSDRQASPDGNSAKRRSVSDLVERLAFDGRLVGALLDDVDARPELKDGFGYRKLIDHLSGHGSSMPVRGSPVVCANVKRIAALLPWRANAERDAEFLATLSRCQRGATDLLRASLADDRPIVAATALRVWWAGAVDQYAPANDLADDVIDLVATRGLPNGTAWTVWVYGGRRAAMIKDGAPVEDVALGLAALGRLTATVERLTSLGRADLADAMLAAVQRSKRAEFLAGR